MFLQNILRNHASESFDTIFSSSRSENYDIITFERIIHETIIMASAQFFNKNLSQPGIIHTEDSLVKTYSLLAATNCDNSIFHEKLRY